MPISAPVAAAGIGLAGTAINAASQGGANKKAREWAERRYIIERHDALKDFNMQNSYNAPSAVMARYREAGLNPNLIYGNGTSAASASVQSTHAQPYRPQAPQLDFSTPVDTYFGAESKMATMSNQQKQGDILDAQKRLLDADLVSKLFENNYKQDTKHLRRTYDAGRANLVSTQHSLAEQNWDLNNVLNDIKFETAQATLGAIRKDNLARDVKLDLSKQDYSFNAYRNKMAKQSADASVAGMKPQDWLKLILGGVQSATPFLPKKR